MSDSLLLAVGAAVFGAMAIGVALTILEFRKLPRRQAPEYESVADQAQPARRPRQDD